MMHWLPVYDFRITASPKPRLGKRMHAFPETYKLEVAECWCVWDSNTGRSSETDKCLLNCYTKEGSLPGSIAHVLQQKTFPDFTNTPLVNIT